jgi:molybdopterin-guanine dinucleotide biosynthesis protein B
MRIFGFTGRSGAGKTTLIEALLPIFIRRGLTVSTMKHAHHGFDMDRPGKDTWRHRDAGAQEVMVVSGERWALLAEHRDPGEPDVDQLIERMNPVDLLLIEGFRAHSHPKIEVFRPSLGKDLLWRPGSDIVAVAGDAPVAGLGVPLLDLNDIGLVADFIADWQAPRRQGAWAAARVAAMPA